MDENLKQNLKKFLPIIIAVLAIIVVVFGIIIFNSGRKNDDIKISTLTLDLNKPIPFKKDNLYGYMTSDKGKEIISAKYTAAKPFYGKFAIVEKSENGNTTFCVIDKKGNERVSSSSNIKYVTDYELFIIDKQLYNSNLDKITNDDYEVTYKDFGYSSYLKHDDKNNIVEGGILDVNGKKVYSYKFKDNESFFGCNISQASDKVKDRYAKVNIDNKKSAILNLASGKIVYDYSEQPITVNDNNIFSVYSSDGKKTVLCYLNGKVAYENSNNVDITYYDIDNKILQITNYDADSSNRISYYDLKANSALAQKPDKNEISALESLTGYKSYNSENSYGVMKGSKKVLPAKYADIEFLAPGLFNYIKDQKGLELVMAKTEDKYEIINLTNKKTIYEVKASSVSTYSSSTFIKYIQSYTDKVCIYNLITGKSMLFDRNSTISVYSNYIIVNQDNTKKYYNINLEEIYTE